MITSRHVFELILTSWALLSLAISLLLPAVAVGGVKVFESEDQSLELGLRLQPRIEYERLATSGGGVDGQRDFLVRRARLKASGKMNGVTYAFEWKIDGTDQVGVSPSAQVENAYLQYPVGHGVEVRAGLYDQPFSRDRLTSDSKQLAVDRGEVSNVPDALGLADNVVGLSVLGKVREGRALYAVGAYDNRFIPGKQQDLPMVVGRVDLNFGSTKDLYQDAHFGSESWYSVGVNGSYQGSLQNALGADDSSNAAGGIDGMIDVPVGSARLLVRGEMNAIRTELHGSSARNNATVRMLGVGVLVWRQRLQPFVRFDQVRGDTWARGGHRDITYAGANLYQRGHSLKLQGDVRMQSGTHQAVDGARLQAQIDF